MSNLNLNYNALSYEVGQSKKEALESLSKKTRERYKDFQPSNSPKLELFGLDKEIRPLLTYQYAFVWLGFLIKNGRNIDKSFDNQLHQLIKLNDSFFNKKEPIKRILHNLLKSREALTNFEIDVEEFLNAVSIIAHLNPLNHGTAVSNILNQVNRTFDSALDLCILKLTNISNARVSFTTIVLSIIAVVIAIFALVYKPLKIEKTPNKSLHPTFTRPAGKNG